MSSKVIVHKGRTNILSVFLGVPVGTDTYTSEIRSEPQMEAPLIATWTVTVVGDGTSGELRLRLDDNDTRQIKANSGYMDLKRSSGGEPLPVFDMPLEVSFRGTVTV
jgi:hypothetical protein